MSPALVVRLISVGTAGVLLWCVILAAIGFGQEGGDGTRPAIFAVLVGLAALAAWIAVLRGHHLAQAIALSASGATFVVVGILGAPTVGLPLVPIGIVYVVGAVVLADTLGSSLQTFVLCGLAAVVAGVVPLVIALTGR